MMEIKEKTILYRNLALSRRAEIKKFEAKMTASGTPANTSPELPPASQ